MMPSPPRLLVLASIVFAIGAPALQMGLGLGLTAAEFSAAGDSTLRAASYAFSIWSVIYLGLIAYAVWQALPRQASDRALSEIAWPAALAIAGCGAWIWASALDARWATVAIIVLSAGVLAVGLMRTAPAPGRASTLALAVAWFPLGLLGGWLAVASALNILTVGTAEGLIGPESAAVAALVGVVAVQHPCRRLHGPHPPVHLLPGHRLGAGGRMGGRTCRQAPGGGGRPDCRSCAGHARRLGRLV